MRGKYIACFILAVAILAISLDWVSSGVPENVTVDEYCLLPVGYKDGVPFYFTMEKQQRYGLFARTSIYYVVKAEDDGTVWELKLFDGNVNTIRYNGTHAILKKYQTARVPGRTLEDFDGFPTTWEIYEPGYE